MGALLFLAITFGIVASAAIAYIVWLHAQGPPSKLPAWARDEIVRRRLGEHDQRVEAGRAVGRLVRARIEAAHDRKLIEDLAGGNLEEPCTFDHHGYCQAHGWMDESECPIPRARRRTRIGSALMAKITARNYQEA